MRIIKSFIIFAKQTIKQYIMKSSQISTGVTFKLKNDNYPHEFTITKIYNDGSVITRDEEGDDGYEFQKDELLSDNCVVI